MMWLAISARPLSGPRPGAVAVLRDVTAEWEEQVSLSHQALHDSLTGVANRHLLIEALVRKVQGLSRRGGSVVLVFCDLDHFKDVNDRYGHDVGDRLLIAVARRLQGAVRADDVVARLGGDEFVVASASADPVPDGDMVVARIRTALSAPYRFGPLVVHVGVSMGWAGTATLDVTPEQLLRRADERMYRDKRERGRTSGKRAGRTWVRSERL